MKKQGRNWGAADGRRARGFFRTFFFVSAASVCGGAVSCGGEAEKRRVIVVDGGNGGTSVAGSVSEGGRPAGDRGGQGGTGGRATTGGEPGMAGAGGEKDEPPCDVTAENTAGRLELVTLSSSCAAADGDSIFAGLSADGRYVGFDSDAADLVANDENGRPDVFLFDLETRALELVSKAYGSDDPSGGDSFMGVLSSDARYVAFTAYSYDLVAGTVPGGIWVYLRDRETATTRRFAADYACAYWLDMSGDAAFIVSEGFTNCEGDVEEDDYVSALEHDVAKSESRHLGMSDDGSDNYRPSISRDGRFIVWGTRPPGTRGENVSRLELYDRVSDTNETLPFYAFHYGSTDISLDGDVIAFGSNGQVYRYVRSTDELVLVSAPAADTPGDDLSGAVSMSDDGRYLVFESSATNLVDGDTNGVADIFLFDYSDGSLERVSVAGDGSEADDESRYPTIAGNGTRLAFASKARNLLPIAIQGNFQTYVLTIADKR